MERARSHPHRRFAPRRPSCPAPMTASTPPPSPPRAAPRAPSLPPTSSSSPPASAAPLPPLPPAASPHAMPPFYAPPYPFSVPFAAAYLHAPPHMYPLHPTWASSPFPFYAWPAPMPAPRAAPSTPQPPRPSHDAPRRRPPRRRSPTPPPPKNTPSTPPAPTKDDVALAAEKALAADDNFVSLSLMLTSWNNALANTADPSAAFAFSQAFHASGALSAIALSDALLSGDHPTLLAQQTTLFDLVVYAGNAVAEPLSSTARSCYATDPALPQRAHLSQLLTLLSDLRLASDAFASVTPANTPLIAEDAALPSGLLPAQALAKSASHVRQGLALIHVQLQQTLLISRYAADIDRLLSHNALFSPLRAHLSRVFTADIAARKSQLEWNTLLAPFSNRVFSCVQQESHAFLNRFHALQQRIHSCLDDVCLFDTPPKSASAKAQQTVNAACAAAALLTAQQRAFDWANHAAVLLRAVRSAVRALLMLAPNMRPPEALVDQFEQAVGDAFSYVQKVVEYASDSAAQRVLTNVAKNTAQGKRTLRFEEPPKQQRSPNARRKPRHARMKSSPDALLHLNAHFDDYGDEGEAHSPKQPDNPTPNSKRAEGDDDNGGHEADDDSDASTDTTRVYEGRTLLYTEDSEHPIPADDATLLSLPGKECDDEIAPQEVHSEDDDGEIIVHESEEDKPKKAAHPSHLRSMSVDGIPF
eukprot:TRINITY_DN2751_c0_g1_i1.p1 TRINITY_DN2751_c0_g1~~TRINITY_DN2751_c0_g1_i1.p1  ORF type:complete len:724 (-),score=171.88 TRINITY_DN2751_c0_g1_i1:575-2677(-)